MPIDVLITQWEDVKDRLLSKYDIEDLCDVLGITTEDILDNFQTLVYNKLTELEITTELDYEDDKQDV